MKTVAAIHTAMPMVEPTRELFAKHLPDVRLINIVDDSLIQDVIQANQVSDAVKKRLLAYFQSAVDAGADVIFNTCSSVGDVALKARENLRIPLVKIDDDMAAEAVAKYNRIGVLATLPTTLSPTVRLLRHFAHLQSKNIEIIEGLAEGAFQAVIGGDKETHDKLILQSAQSISNQVDAFVLAQGSMARMEKQLLTVTGKNVLSSPERGVLNVKHVLQSLANDSKN